MGKSEDFGAPFSPPDVMAPLRHFYDREGNRVVECIHPDRDKAIRLRDRIIRLLNQAEEGGEDLGDTDWALPWQATPEDKIVDGTGAVVASCSYGRAPFIVHLANERHRTKPEDTFDLMAVREAALAVARSATKVTADSLAVPEKEFNDLVCALCKSLGVEDI